MPIAQGARVSSLITRFSAFVAPTPISKALLRLSCSRGFPYIDDRGTQGSIFEPLYSRQCSYRSPPLLCFLEASRAYTAAVDSGSSPVIFSAGDPWGRIDKRLSSEGCMVRLAVALLAAVVLVSCATSREIQTAEGKQGYSIECRAVLSQSFDCIEKAQQLCGIRGYRELEKSVESFKSNMIIQCK